MNHKKRMHTLASLVTVCGLFGVISVSGCGGIDDLKDVVEGCDSDFTAQADWGANLDIDYRVKSFMGASGALVTLSSAMLKDVTDACVGIATATKADASKWESAQGTDRLTAACDAANLGMDAVFAANAAVTFGVLVEGGGCEADLSATAACNAKCDVSGKCTPAQLEAKCEPGQLAGTCGAQCSGSCTAKTGTTVTCNGACSATCNGPCTGTCVEKDANGDCAGRCDGTCNGTCSGTCTYQTNTMASCDGTCKGDCSVAFEAPHCEGKLTPPECSLDADCESSCRAQVQAEAKCTPPTVKLEVQGTAGADFMALKDALELHLPKLIQNIGVRGQATINAADTLVSVGQNLGDAITSSGKALVCTTVAASAAVDASVEVKVSVEASASVGANAGAATN
ncbi:MAG TPA: hypothetical protein PK156_12375 [Polyangium sp.]|nr:hypothetical protein [Polyangium sp.]